MDFVIHRGTADPVSAQMARQFARAIRAGEFLPGERLPSVRKLRARLSVAYNTVLRAYADLMKAGFAYSVPATGTFVAHHAPPPPVRGDAKAETRERKHFIRLAEGLIVQSERCGYDIDDALAEVRLMAKTRRKRIERYVREHKGRRTIFERSLEERRAAMAAEEAAQRAQDEEEIRAGLAEERARKEQEEKKKAKRKPAKQSPRLPVRFF
ncbi:MAG: GntR family transcriptional regulator [Planctomycetota bacterium]|jgi:DNA-binding transcriptional regulator YhcF (GntR family)